MSKKFKPCLKKRRTCLICRKRPNGHQVVTNEQSYLNFFLRRGIFQSASDQKLAEKSVGRYRRHAYNFEQQFKSQNFATTRYIKCIPKNLINFFFTKNIALL
jgi:hypothetical protein